MTLHAPPAALRTRALATALALAAALAGCARATNRAVIAADAASPSDPMPASASASMSMPMPAPGGGLTLDPRVGRDIREAREVIVEGGVPYEDSVTVERLLREHDVSDDGGECRTILCSRPGLAVAPRLASGENEYWVQLGLTSVLDADEFVRPGIDMVILVDRSSGMIGDLRETYDAVEQLLARLRADDRVAVLAYNERVVTVRGLGPVGDRAAVMTDLRAHEATGTPDMTPALRVAQAIVRPPASPPDRLKRVMLFSCENPRGTLVGAWGGDAGARDDGEDFATQLRDGARDHIGTSFFGILLEREAVAAAMLLGTRGGAYYTVAQLSQIARVFDGDFEAMITPIAYDVTYGLALDPGFVVAGVYGVDGVLGAPAATQFSVATAFVNARRGAVLARVRRRAGEGPVAGARVGDVSLAYAPEPAVRAEDPQRVSEALAFPAALGGATRYYSRNGVRRGVALVNTGEQLRAALRAWHAGDRGRAREVTTRLADYLAREAEAGDDHALRRELALVRRLQRNMGE